MRFYRNCTHSSPSPLLLSDTKLESVVFRCRMRVRESVCVDATVEHLNARVVRTRDTASISSLLPSWGRGGVYLLLPSPVAILPPSLLATTRILTPTRAYIPASIRALPPEAYAMQRCVRPTPLPLPLGEYYGKRKFAFLCTPFLYPQRFS